MEPTIFDFDTLPNRRETESVKWRLFGDENTLPMWVADMDFRSPPAVIKALRERVDHGVFGYALPLDGLKESIVDWLITRHNWEVSPEHLVLIPGVVGGFNLAAHTVANVGDGVVVQTPNYGPFFGVAKNANLVQQETQLLQDEDGQYSIDYDAFEAALTGRSRIFMLCNPQNPTGRVFRRDELEKMAEICLQNDIIICSDEIHSDLVFSGHPHIPIASLSPEVAEKTITLIAPSKTFNIAGLSASIAIIPNDDLRVKYERSTKGLLGHVNLLGMIAARAAYQDGAPWLDALLKYLENNRDYLVEYVNNQLPGLKMTVPEGTYLGWIDCRGAGIEEEAAEFFKKEANVLVNGGAWFGKGGEGFIRINFGCPRSMLVEALDKMKAVLG